MSWLLALAWACVRPRAALVFENLALRQQLNVARRSVKRPRLTNADRLFWIGMVEVFPGWREALCLVKPDTVLRWHSKGWRAYWRWKSRAPRRGRPPIGWKLVRLIHRMSMENPTWGAPRIQNELLLLGHDVGESTVSRYMARNRFRGRGQGWMTFLRNHMKVTAACDFFMVPSITFRSLFVFVVLSHDRRQIRHIAVTEHPTAEWTARQIIEAFPGGEEPRFLLHDRDGAFSGEEFARQLRTMCIRELLTAPQSPWLNCYVERVIGTIRRDCTDHIIPFGERHLLATLREYVAYYNSARAHQSLDGNSPIPRAIAPEPAAELRAMPVLGGLHHVYTSAA